MVGFQFAGKVFSRSSGGWDGRSSARFSEENPTELSIGMVVAVLQFSSFSSSLMYLFFKLGLNSGLLAKIHDLPPVEGSRMYVSSIRILGLGLPA